MSQKQIQIDWKSQSYSNKSWKIIVKLGGVRRSEKEEWGGGVRRRSEEEEWGGGARRKSEEEEQGVGMRRRREEEGWGGGMSRIFSRRHEEEVWDEAWGGGVRRGKVSCLKHIHLLALTGDWNQTKLLMWYMYKNPDTVMHLQQYFTNMYFGFDMSRKDLMNQFAFFSDILLLTWIKTWFNVNSAMYPTSCWAVCSNKCKIVQNKLCSFMLVLSPLTHPGQKLRGDYVKLLKIKLLKQWITIIYLHLTN